ncbi:hypothetical protein HHK36_003818 [Tetracentron sinense]|uniref:Uncharacterized protein n=1 Tax=Tetracentron sinense TaxID=13715 RepID=A0A835DPN5_TETSI|nr:hypothetical protein HHK36_003818 [Tetracentron sinense]
MDTEEWSMNAFIFFLLFQFCTSIDTIMPTKFITDGDILVSTGEKFALGFFSPGSSRDRYLGIWYNKISEQTPVWVANRETPLKNSNGGVVTINGDGNLVVFDRNQNSTVLWSTNVTNHHNDKDSIAKLLDSGNLVLIEAHSQRVLWQSFDYPADTFIPGMTLGQSKKMGMRWLLTSWKSRNDPARGNYWYALDPRGSPQFFVYKGLTPYWRSGPWIGKGLNGLPEMARPLVSNVSLVNHDGEVYITYSLFNDSILSRIILDETGSLHVLIWIKAINRWNSFGRAPRDRCDDYGHCGPYGRCTTNDVMECECLPGFEPKSLRDWNLRDWSAGCVRKRVQECGKGEGFLKLSREKVPDTLISLVDNSLNLKECKKKCLSNCSCKAYTNSDFNGGGIGCITWYGELMDIREFINGEQDLYVRVDSIEIANARKSKGFLGKKRNLAILVVAIVVGLFLLVSSGYCLLKKMIKKKGVTENQRNPDMSLFNLATSATSFGDSPGMGLLECR